MMARKGLAGFTLLEVLIALTVGGMALGAAAALLHGLGERAESLDGAVARHDRAANAERLMRSLFANLDLRPEAAPAAEGDERSVRVQSWCPTSHGWLAPCRGRLFFDSSDGGVALRIELAGAGVGPVTMILRRGLAGRFRYLLDPAYGGSWTDTWSAVTVPAAVQMIMDADTILAGVWTGG